MNMTFEQALARLETIAAEIADEKTTIERAVALYGEGAEIALFCRQELDKKETAVWTIQQSLSGKGFEFAPFR